MIGKEVKSKVIRVDEKGNFIIKIDEKNYAKVPGAILDEEVEVIIERRLGKYFWRAKIIDIISKSEKRRKPICPYFLKCGGCKWQHIKYDFQIKLKKDLLIRAFNKYGVNITEDYLEIVPAEEEFYYRNRIDFCCLQKNFEKYIGLREEDSWKEVVDLEYCYLIPKEVNKVYSELRDIVKNNFEFWNILKKYGDLRYLVFRYSFFRNKTTVIFTRFKKEYKLSEDILKVARNCNVWVCINDTPTDESITNQLTKIQGDDYIEEKVGNFVYKYYPNSFFQTNPKMANKMEEIILENVEDGKVCLDLYCGVGLHGIQVANKFEKVYGIEIDEKMVELANYNAKENSIDNFEAYCGDAGEFLKKFVKDVDCIIVDPPRGGLTQEVIKGIIRTKPKVLVYVSCNPQTQARDLSLILTALKKAQLKKIYLLDNFPQTPHMETIAIIERK